LKAAKVQKSNWDKGDGDIATDVAVALGRNLGNKPDNVQGKRLLAFTWNDELTSRV
jgi:hypothetical protein